MRKAIGYLADRYESRPRLPRKTVCESKGLIKPPSAIPRVSPRRIRTTDTIPSKAWQGYLA